jgi:protein disulfide-isomerase A6
MILKCHIQSSLASIIQKRGLSPAKLDEIKIKANILKAFVAEEVEEKAGSFAKKATAEL